MRPRPPAISIVVAGLAVAALVTARCGGGGPGAPRPDVLLLVMDTTRADRCSVTGYDRPTTPCLERLAKESVVFDDAWSPASWTMPAHAALFTGRSPDSLGLMAPDRDALGPDTPTLAGRLTEAGWTTRCFTCNAWIAPHSGLTRGFEKTESFYPASPTANARVAHEHALTWMREQRKAGKRFFAFINDIEPHAPWAPPPEYEKGFVDPAIPRAVVDDARSIRPPRSTRISLGAEAVGPEVLHAVSGLYDGDVASLDHEVGALLDSMRAEGLLDGTLVVVAGDHGEGLMQHGWLEHSVMLHRELLRVPLLVRPVGGCAPRRVSTPVELHDVFPTILEACGLPVPPDTEVRSLLTDASPRVPRAKEVARFSFLNGFRTVAPNVSLEVAKRTRRSIYDGRWQLIVDDLGEVELYDVAADPMERKNLAGTQPDVVARLRAQLAAPR